MKMLFCLLLVALLSTAWANQPELPRTCRLDVGAREALIKCVKETSGSEVMTKLNAVGKVLMCGDDMECGIKKTCADFHGSLEKAGRGIIQDEDLPKIREIFNACLDKH
ncbi:hypothetical protein HPB50_016907 [Hyalomma asiaticum]|uniref:Uncharacterized protein n=1 Tax=Hyalomma asiaticum TaxID=266040 RepID=A0ACB7TLM3_HYAAI|nr:hypothetical protein HPB50_016907 [Hyalomma asiaticum]